MVLSRLYKERDIEHIPKSTWIQDEHWNQYLLKSISKYKCTCIEVKKWLEVIMSEL